MKKIAAIFLLSATLLSCNDKNPEVIERNGEPDVVLVENSNDEMNNAVLEAQKTLPEFEKAFKSNNDDYTNFTLKQQFSTDDGGGEHMWIGDIELRDGKFFGVLQNEPVYVKTLKIGDEIEVDKNNISDWMFYDKNVVKGGYTVKVLRKQMTAEEKAMMDEGGLIYD